MENAYITSQSSSEKLEQLKSVYYDTHKKNVFFKSEQKFHAAQTVCSQLEMDELLHNTCWIIPNTNKVYFEYSVFKHYACPANFELVVDKVSALCLHCIQHYHTFEVHMNLASFSISAAERYQKIIEMFCNKGMLQNTSFSMYLTSLNLYNIPIMIENISRILSSVIPPEVKSKVCMFKKDVSDAKLQELHFG